MLISGYKRQSFQLHLQIRPNEWKHPQYKTILSLFLLPFFFQSFPGSKLSPLVTDPPLDSWLIGGRAVTLNSRLHSGGVSAVLPSTHLSSIQDWSGHSPNLLTSSSPPTPWEACFLRKVQPCRQNPVIAGEVVPTDDFTLENWIFFIF